MKKIFTFFLGLTATVLNAQYFSGFINDGYSGINGLIINPSSIVDTRYKYDINLFGGNINLDNDYVGLYVPSFLGDISGDHIKERGAFNVKKENNIFLNLDMLLPSFSYSFDEKSTVAVSTRLRSMSNINGVDGNYLKSFEKGFNKELLYKYRMNNLTVALNSWYEIGVTYASKIYDSKQKKLKIGITTKYIKGLGSLLLHGKNLELIAKPGKNLKSDADNTRTDTGELKIESSESFKRHDMIVNQLFDSEANSLGYGFDFGLTFEVGLGNKKSKPSNKKNKHYQSAYNQFTRFKDDYKFKIGMAVTDVGSILYNQGRSTKYILNRTKKSPDGEITYKDTQKIDSESSNLYEVLDIYYYTKNNSKQQRNGMSSKLPTAFNINLDYRINEKLYLNFYSNLDIADKTLGNHTANYFSLTGRYQNKSFSCYLPINYQQYSGVSVGFGFRYGVFYMGSNTLLSNIISSEAKSANICVGIKFPIINNGPKNIDSDNDGVLDKVDKCPEVPGSIKNDGCPEKGNAKSTKDKSTKGKVTKDAKNLEKRIKKYAKLISFNSSKSSFKKGRTIKALNYIVYLMKRSPNTSFYIEGHTDSQGKASGNLQLSEERAKAVLRYFVKKGINISRLSSIGYGEEYPIRSNSTPEGRAINRRVNIKLKK